MEVGPARPRSSAGFRPSDALTPAIPGLSPYFLPGRDQIYSPPEPVINMRSVSASEVVSAARVAFVYLGCWADAARRWHLVRVAGAANAPPTPPALWRAKWLHCRNIAAEVWKLGRSYWKQINT